MSEYILPHVDGYLKLGQDFDCSDIHLAVNSRPTWRRFGQLLPIWEEAPNLTPQDTEVLARGFLEDPEWNRLQLKGDVDFAYANDFGRYRASVVKQRLGYDICFRIINTRVRTMEEIGLPTEYVVPLTRYTNGLILVTGSVGSGKSTTLASIVDEETANNAEKPMVAGMYINRLRTSMPLQADPTVKFALHDFSLRRIYHNHLNVESPYNTYRNTGLPPGPIRIPSIAGIDAVLNHAKHDYLYMCAKEDFSGTHNFASNYADHMKNARKYWKALNERKIFN